MNKVNYKSGFVGLIGQPNAGKSSLMNILVDEKVSIVTAKPQTTRRRMIGIVSKDQGQIIYVDAPGVLRPSKGLNGFLAKEAQDVIQQSDVLMGVFALDTKEKEHVEDIVKMLDESKKPWFAVITKVDMTELSRRVETLKELFSKHNNCFGVVEFTNSEAREDRELRSLAKKQIYELSLQKLPDAPKPLYDVELFTTSSTKDLVAEIVREQCFEVLHHEIPYSIAVRISKYDENEGGMPKIYGEILVSKESHKPILIGKGGTTIKEIGMLARKSVEKLLDQKVFLSLEVAVREDWFENTKLMKELGYVVE